jgi:hypothetical protein
MLQGADEGHWERLRVMVDAAVNSFRSAVNRIAAAVHENNAVLR